MGNKQLRGKRHEAVRPRHNSKLELPVTKVDEFLKFCDSRMAGENVRFYLAVVHYEKLYQQGDVPRDQIVQAAESIVVQFLSSKSPHQIGLDDKVAKKILETYESATWNKDTFRAARIEVVCTLTDQMVPAFERSKKVRHQ